MKKNDYKKTLFIGDVNVDLIFGGLTMPVLEDKEVTASSFELTMGSTSIITAVAYSSLGGSAESSGLAGDDDYGRYMLRRMKELHIGTSRISIDPQIPTGVTANLIYGDTRSQVTFPGTIETFPGPDLSSDYSDISHVHLSGIYQQTAFLQNIEETLRTFKNMGITTSLDTQWDSCEKWQYLDEILPLVDILFVNTHEAASISGTDDLEQNISYFSTRCAMTALKLGSQGSLIIRGDKRYAIPAFPVDVVDTTGAGDSYAGAFLFALNELQMDIEKAGYFASAAGARSCLFQGGVNAASSVKDIEKFQEEHHVY